MNIIDIGNERSLDVNFTDVNGNPIDPTTITLRVRDPDGTQEVFTYPTQVQRSGVGAYFYIYKFTDYGIYSYRYEGDGAAVAAGDNQIQVTNSPTLSC